eukprot:357992-Chlamydomonas_euryale.AAC.3
MELAWLVAGSILARFWLVSGSFLAQFWLIPSAEDEAGLPHFWLTPGSTPGAEDENGPAPLLAHLWLMFKPRMELAWLTAPAGAVSRAFSTQGGCFALTHAHTTTCRLARTAAVPCLFSTRTSMHPQMALGYHRQSRTLTRPRCAPG